jgi:hypothetical protein
LLTWSEIQRTVTTKIITKAATVALVVVTVVMDSCEQGNETSDSIKCGEYLIFRKDSDPH